MTRKVRAHNVVRIDSVTEKIVSFRLSVVSKFDGLVEDLKCMVLFVQLYAYCCIDAFASVRLQTRKPFAEISFM